MSSFKEILNNIKSVLDYQLFTIGGESITLWTIVFSVLFITLLVITANRLSKLLAKRVLTKKLDAGNSQAIALLFKYIVITIGTIIILSSAGIDLSVLTVVLGTLGVGIGFGLQSITSNFISGIIILFERPIKVGDRIEIGNTKGDVVKVAFRTTTIVTPDNISIIVPNSDFITKEVINWNYNDEIVRHKISIGVSYSTDVKLVEKILLEVANNNNDVLKEPAPNVRFVNFGDSSLNFELRVWTTIDIFKLTNVLSDINFSILEQFNKNNIEIPYPQRVVHHHNIDSK